MTYHEARAPEGRAGLSGREVESASSVNRGKRPSCPAWCPRHVVHACRRVGLSREDEEQIAKPIEVDDDLVTRWRVVESEHVALGASAHRPGKMKRRGLRATARQYE